MKKNCKLSFYSVQLNISNFETLKIQPKSHKISDFSISKALHKLSPPTTAMLIIWINSQKSSNDYYFKHIRAHTSNQKASVTIKAESSTEEESYFSNKIFCLYTNTHKARSINRLYMEHLCA